MAQADGTVANGSGAAVRADINNQLAAVFTNHSGSTEPSTIKPHQFWYDDSVDILKLRESGSWTSLREATGEVILPAGSAAAPSIYFSGETGTGFYEYANNVVGIGMAGNADSGGTETTTTYGVIGRTLESQTNAFVIGPAASRSTAQNPTNGNNDKTSSGFCVANDGPLHIGAYNLRPVTLNLMGPGGTTGQMIRFNFNGSAQGNITYTGTGIAYNTTSDYRVKENVVALAGAKDRVNQLNVYRFNFISNPSQTVDGFLAHEAQAVVPEAVTGDRDATLADGTPDYQSIDQSKIVPLLTAALQEAFAEIAALTARVEALEAN